MISCADICDTVTTKLMALGFDLGDDDNTNHGRILDTLADCVLVPLKPIQGPRRGYAPQLCPDRQITIEERIASLISNAIHVEPESPHFNVEETSQTLRRMILRQVLAEFRPDLFDREDNNAN